MMPPTWISILRSGNSTWRAPISSLASSRSRCSRQGGPQAAGGRVVERCRRYPGRVSHLARESQSKLLQVAFGFQGFKVSELVSNPANEQAVAAELDQHGFTVRACETFRPSLSFKNFKEFLDFGYYGGWLTPFIEALDLHKAAPSCPGILNRFVFPVQDHHSIVIAVAQKTSLSLVDASDTCSTARCDGGAAVRERPMRIAIIAEVFLPKVDGVVNRTMNLIQLSRRGDELLVVCPQARAARLPVPGHRRAEFSFPLYPEYRMALPDGSLVGPRGLPPDVLHYVNPFAFGFRCYDFFQRAGLPSPASSRFTRSMASSSNNTRFSARFRRCCGGCRASTTTGRTSTHGLNGDARGPAEPRLPPSRALAARGGRRAVPPQPQESRKCALACPTDRWTKPLLLTVSRLAPEKNVGFLAEVLDRFPKCLPRGGRRRPAASRAGKRFGGKNANFVGYLRENGWPRRTPRPMPSCTPRKQRPWATSMLEAMACGCAVAAPRRVVSPVWWPRGRRRRCTRRVMLKTRFGHCARCSTIRARACGWAWRLVTRLPRGTGPGPSTTSGQCMKRRCNSSRRPRHDGASARTWRGW